jgi:hypothetical protein
MALRLSHRVWLIVAAVAIVSVLTAGALAAQARQFRPMDPLPEPVVLSGADVGFRVEGMIDGVPAGRLVVRSRSGEWVEPRVVGRGGVIPLTAD